MGAICTERLISGGGGEGKGRFEAAKPVFACEGILDMRREDGGLNHAPPLFYASRQGCQMGCVVAMLPIEEKGYFYVLGNNKFIY